MKLLFALLAISIAQSSMAANLSTLVRTYTHSCGYYTNTTADFRITYKNLEIPWGTRITLIYGFSNLSDKGYEVDWQYRKEQEMSAIDAYTWSTELSETIHTRSSAPGYDHLVFILKVIFPDGSVFYEQGSQRPWSYYQLEIPRDPTCITTNKDFPPYITVTPVVIEQKQPNLLFQTK